MIPLALVFAMDLLYRPAHLPEESREGELNRRKQLCFPQPWGPPSHLDTRISNQPQILFPKQFHLALNGSTGRTFPHRPPLKELQRW